MEKALNYKIQILRAFAIIAVVLIHTCYGGKWQYLFRPFINYAVPLFLFISGLLTKEDSICKDSVLRKIRRVLIPYVVWTFIYTLPTFDIKEYLNNLLLTTNVAHGVMYYIVVYIQFVLLSPFLGKLAKSKLKWIGWVISPLSVIVFQYAPRLLSFGFSNLTMQLWVMNFSAYFVYYWMGFLLRNKYIEVSFSWRTLFLMLAGSIVLQILEGFIFYTVFNDTVDCGTVHKFSAIITNLIVLLVAYKFINDDSVQITNKVLVELGDYSFGIYLSHMLILRLINLLIPAYNSIPFVLNSAIILLLSFILSYVGYMIFGSGTGRNLGFR